MTFWYYFPQITGAGHGIGRELAILFAKQNSIIVCWDLDEKGNEETKQMLNLNGHKRVYTFKYVRSYILRTFISTLSTNQLKIETYKL